MKVALLGYAGAGKGLVAELIQEVIAEWNTQYTHTRSTKDTPIKGSFAYPIKEFLRRLCNMTDQHLYGELKEVPMTFIVTPESFNQAAKFYLEYGLDDYVSFDRMWEQFKLVLKYHISGLEEEGLWSIHSISSRRLQQLLGTEIMRHYKDTVWIDIALVHQFDIIDDLRFLNEAAVLKANGYTIIRVSGKDTRLTNEADKSHASERDIPLIKEDYVIANGFDTYDSTSRDKLKTRVASLMSHLHLI